MSTDAFDPSFSTPPRRRLSKADRQRQLLDNAWSLIRKEGTDALTLSTLADQSGVTKPLVYEHFGTRSGLLACLYREFDDRQTTRMISALKAGEPTLSGMATVIAASYMECVLAQGSEIPGIIAALASSPELEKVKRECEAAFMAICRDALVPFAPAIGLAGLRAMLGAAEALSGAAASGELDAVQAQDELYQTIVAMALRNAGQATS